MAIEDLGGFIEVLEKHGELRRVAVQVDPDLEISEILRRTMYDKGPAILFEDVKGSEMPVLGNAFGSMRRLELGLEMSDFTEIGERITAMTKMEVPAGLLGKLRDLPKLSKMTESFPKPQKSGPVTEITEQDPSFDGLPILKTWPKDAGRFITLGLVATRHPENRHAEPGRLPHADTGRQARPDALAEAQARGPTMATSPASAASAYPRP